MSKKLILKFIFAFLAGGIIAASTPSAQAQGCAGPCAAISVACQSGQVITGPAAQANLLAAACGRQLAKTAKVAAVKPLPPIVGSGKVAAVKPLPPIVEKSAQPVSLETGWVTPKVPSGCDVNSPRPAVDLGQGLTLTCDSQGPVKRGWNVKPLGAAEPVRLNAQRGQNCLLRFGGGTSVSCQVRVKAYKANGSGFVFLSEKGEKYEVTKSFGGWSANKL